MKLLLNLFLTLALVAAACEPQYEPGEPGEILGALADPDPMGARDIAVANGFAIATGSALDNAGQAWLKVVDIRNPRDPELLAELSSAGSIGDAVEFDGRYAYATVIQGSSLDFVVVDVFDPTGPQEVRRIPIPGEEVTAREGRGMEVVSGFAYVAATDSGFHVIDVRSPASASLVASRALPGTLPWDLEIWGDEAVVAGNKATVDVHSPTNPVVTKSGAGFYRDVDGDDGLLFVQFSGSVWVYEPGFNRVGTLTWGADRIEVAGGLLAARGNATIRFFDASVPSQIQPIGETVWTPGIGKGLAIEGDLVLVGDSMHTLVVIQAP
jgi:hypothetical protein